MLSYRLKGKQVVLNRKIIDRFMMAAICGVFIFVNVGCGKPIVRLDGDFFDLGSFRNGENKKLEILISNSGDAPLEIKYVGSSCGCVEVEKYDERISEMQKGKVVLAINSMKSHFGRNTQQVLFKTNDPDKKYIKIFHSHPISL